MQNTHIFNEKLNRFEPIDSKCMFCETGHSQNRNDNCFIPLLKENNSRTTVGVPRCSRCLKIHKSARLKARLLAWGTGMVICLSLLIFVHWKLNISRLESDVLAFSIAIATGIVISIALGITVSVSRFLENKFIKRKGILTKQEGVNKYEVIQKLIRDGWIYDKPLFSHNSHFRL